MEFTKLYGFNDTGIAAYTGGNPKNTAVVLIHDEGQTHYEWSALARDLIRKGYRVISIEQRGHGQSDRSEDYSIDALSADLLNIIKSLDIKPIVVTSGSSVDIALRASRQGSNIEGTSGISALIVAHMYQEGNNELERFTNLSNALSQGVVDMPAAIQLCTEYKFKDMTPSALHPYMKFNSGQWFWHGDPCYQDSRFCKGIAPTLSQQSEVSIPTFIVTADELESEKSRLLRCFSNKQIIHVDQYRSRLRAVNDRDEFDQAICSIIEKSIIEQSDDPMRAQDLRRALGSFATGVTVISTKDSNGLPIGLTANSFTSVSLDPPLVLFCIDKRSKNLTAFETAPAFAVNILSHEQAAISGRFASKDEDRFALTPWETWDLNVPIIQHSSASFECERHNVVDAGDHLVFFGKVHNTLMNNQHDPLLYYKGKYREVKPLDITL